MLHPHCCVYALVFGSLALATAQPGFQSCVPVGERSPAAVGPERAAGALGASDPRAGVDMWWAFMEMRVVLLCAVLDCNGVDRSLPRADGEEPPVASLMRQQVVSYFASGLRPGLTPDEITEAAKTAGELAAAMETAPAELGPSLKNDYADMLEGVSHDLAGSAF